MSETSSHTNAFLGVESSILGQRWLGLAPAADRAAMGMAQSTGLPDIICRILAARGVAADHAESFLGPKLRDLLPDPSDIHDMDYATDVFAKAVTERARIAVFADYDVDGAASAALLKGWLQEMGHEATLYIPDRIDEGYGPNTPAMQALAANHDLILCVDCGTVSFEPIAAVAPTPVIVLDHHQAHETLPDAVAVVNPNRQDESGALGHLCAAAVVFLLLVSTNRYLRARGQDVPDLIPFLDLVALATVADVAPLIGVNRALVRQGLAVMAQRKRPGLSALCDIAKITERPNAYHLGFILGPRINAGGRIGAADLGARLLSTRNIMEAQQLATQMDRLNLERREIEATVLEDAKAQVEARGANNPIVWAAGEGWHPGVVGIVAARLKEWARRPAVVIGLESGLGKGSARSVTGIDLGAAVATLRAEGLLEQGGGHKMAAGLSLKADQLEAAMERLGALVQRQSSQFEATMTLKIDASISPSGANLELLERLAEAGPFGQGNPAPRFAIPNARIASTRRAGDTHLQLRLQDEAGTLDAIAFRAFDGSLGPFLEQNKGSIVHLAGRLEIDDWGGRRRPKLRIEDASAAG